MFKKLISIILIVSLQSVLVADGYNAGGDFSLDNALNFHGDVNFSHLQPWALKVFLREWILTVTVYTKFYLLLMKPWLPVVPTLVN